MISTFHSINSFQLVLETDRFCVGFFPKQIIIVAVSLSNCNYSPCIMIYKWGLWRPFRNKPSTNTQIKKAIEMCLALENFAISFSMSFVAVWILINDPCLPHEDKKRVVPYTAGLQGLQKPWTHVLPKTQSQYLLIFWHCRALGPGHLMLISRGSHELSQLVDVSRLGGGLF